MAVQPTLAEKSNLIWKLESLLIEKNNNKEKAVFAQNKDIPKFTHSLQFPREEKMLSNTNINTGIWGENGGRYGLDDSKIMLNISNSMKQRLFFGENTAEKSSFRTHF